MTENAPQAAGDVASAAAPEVFPPTLREVLLRPWWLGMLGVALVIAGVFAWLGQWQLGSAIDTDPPPAGMNEQVRPLAEVTEPGQYLPEPLVGQMVEASGRWIAGDFIPVASRFNEGVEGYWVTGQLRLDADTTGSAQPTSLAVAVGWAPTREAADAAIEALEAEVAQDPDATVHVTGRLISDEGPGVPPAGADPQTMTRMSPAALLSHWHDIEGLDVYRAYLTSSEPFGGLTGIHSPAPEEGSTVNWLNIFYAAEWVVFAGFAFYMWYRLARDAWEKEVESLEESAPPAP
ncbi:SURF1 family cytochrome oxidase biogenesis protein [Microbacterium sp. zg-YB36]|uniref:SURF1 family protein n=1 Tax=Microbacterium sp. zg-YB36 TaxID=2969407 RepID=UPI00214BD41D|nr:SURF1 family cytochrome oxidase biogenesis protein [Microbacterium sp. zg-YB36]MDL5352413.1 SURF1 family cytochrome oxidase biogenesis protein [Microbacterium sp. zg-YB36]